MVSTEYTPLVPELDEVGGEVRVVVSPTTSVDVTVERDSDVSGGLVVLTG